MASYDLIVVTDATASMGQYLTSLRSSIPEIIALSTLSGVFKRVGVLAYKDYTEPTETVAWSGWNSPDLSQFVENLAPTGGGDYPEAAKSALIRALQEIKKVESDNTLVLWYTDAPPHHPSMRSYLNDQEEIKAFPKGSTDWVKLCKLARKMKMTVFSFVPRQLESAGNGRAAASFYVLLSQLTGGLCISSDTSSSSEISRLTLEVVLQWMNQGGEIDERLQSTKVKFSHFEPSPTDFLTKMTDELENSLGFLPPSMKQSAKQVELRSILCNQLHAADIPLGENLPTMTFVQRLKDPAEEHYQEQVYASLHSVIEKNVVALTLNNVFGQVWRAVCSQPVSDQQTELLNAFSKRVGAISDPIQKKALQDWLDNSYDATAKIEEMIAKAEPGGPKVCLDLDTDIGLTRIELLEVSKSCYSEVLRKVASVFTHLKLVEADVEMAPGHRYIPLSLPAQEFFRTIPHLVVSGTLYPTRSASITAVLALVTGVPFLREKALEILTPLKGTWINLEIPENISYECAKFLLSAPEGLVLSDKEKKIYHGMRRYKLIELNMQSNVSVKQGWTPEKTMGVGDCRVECASCNVMRSVTMMSEDQKGVCGLCAVEFKGNRAGAAKVQSAGEMASCWVECSMKDCRAQYVVERYQLLNVRPKCWYCRQKRKCPWQECSKCLNRVVVPTYLRAKGKAKYLCPACQPDSQVTSVVSVETTVQALVKENGMSWLGVKPNKDLFIGKSAFKLMTEHGIDVFGRVPIGSLKLTWNSKHIHEPSEVVRQVENWVETGTVELGCCALCFSDMHKSKLMPACGRSGCKQRADDDCLKAWYGNAEPGRLLNVMELMCPFCRRLPDRRTISRYNPRAMALGNLKVAVEDRRWFYAWCIECGFAKQAFERACAQGPLPPVVGFRCPDCIAVSERVVLLVRREEEGVREEVEEPQMIKQGRSRITRCPECKIPVERIDGCNHIECSCGTHFCHYCGAGDKTWDSNDCYDHMSYEHGGCWDFEIHEDND